MERAHLKRVLKGTQLLTHREESAKTEPHRQQAILVPSQRGRIHVDWRTGSLCRKEGVEQTHRQLEYVESGQVKAQPNATAGLGNSQQGIRPERLRCKENATPTEEARSKAEASKHRGSKGKGEKERNTTKNQQTSYRARTAAGKNCKALIDDPAARGEPTPWSTHARPLHGHLRPRAELVAVLAQPLPG